jgi:hypothetical protein
VVWDISNPSSPKLVVAYECPASQNDVSVYKNLMFMSAEAQNGRIDCKPGGVREAVSKERMRGVRIFDISNIKEPKLVANVQTCRGSHTHTVLEDPKDKENVYIYVSGFVGHSTERRTRRVRRTTCPADDPNSSRLRIEIIKVPLANPAQGRGGGRANIFAGLKGRRVTACPTPTRRRRRSSCREAARASGAFTAQPAVGMDMVCAATSSWPDARQPRQGARRLTRPNGGRQRALRPLVQGHEPHLRPGRWRRRPR